MTTEDRSLLLNVHFKQVVLYFRQLPAFWPYRSDFQAKPNMFEPGLELIFGLGQVAQTLGLIRIIAVQNMTAPNK